MEKQKYYQKSSDGGYKNQKKIIVHKANTNFKTNGGINFSQFQEKAVYTAMQNLSASAFQLYIYLGFNKDKYDFWLSRVAVMNVTGIKSNTSYSKAVKELIEKGYLKSVDGNIYNFFEDLKEEDCAEECSTEKTEIKPEEQYENIVDEIISNTGTDVKTEEQIETDFIKETEVFTEQEKEIVSDLVTALNWDEITIPELDDRISKRGVAAERIDFIIEKVKDRMKILYKDKYNEITKQSEEPEIATQEIESEDCIETLDSIFKEMGL